jgi:hypothetical protein
MRNLDRRGVTSIGAETEDVMDARPRPSALGAESLGAGAVHDPDGGPLSGRRQQKPGEVVRSGRL